MHEALVTVGLKTDSRETLYIQLLEVVIDDQRTLDEAFETIVSVLEPSADISLGTDDKVHLDLLAITMNKQGIVTGLLSTLNFRCPSDADTWQSQ